MITLEQERMNILTQAVEHREREIMHHQINIDNYRLAIKEIEANHSEDVELQKFSAELKSLLSSSIAEQAKEKIMLKVLKAQLE
jgi:vancomycin permeability regulator SanA